MDRQPLIRVPFDALAADWPAQKDAIALQIRYNQLGPDADAEREQILDQLFAERNGSFIMPPLNVAWGSEIRIGRKAFINANVELSAYKGAGITIGDHTLIGPNAKLMCVYHPVDPGERQRWAFWAEPIVIGENVWIGSNALICAGVTIGDHSVIGAGSVVTRDVPRCTLVAGNPARVIRELDEPDPHTLYALNP